MLSKTAMVPPLR